MVAAFVWWLICVPNALYRKLYDWAIYYALCRVVMGYKFESIIGHFQATLSEKGFLVNSGNQGAYVHNYGRRPRRELMYTWMARRRLSWTCHLPSGTQFRRLVMGGCSTKHAIDVYSCWFSLPCWRACDFSYNDHMVPPFSEESFISVQAHHFPCLSLLPRVPTWIL